MRSLPLLFLVLVLTACATSRYVSGFDVEQFRALETRKATKAEVLLMAGEPIIRVPGSDGTELWTYIRTEAQGFAVILPFYAYVEARPHQRQAVLTFRGEALEKVEFR